MSTVDEVCGVFLAGSAPDSPFPDPFLRGRVVLTLHKSDGSSLFTTFEDKEEIDEFIMSLQVQRKVVWGTEGN